MITAEREGARVQRLDAGGRSLASWVLDVEAGDGALAVAADDSTRVAVADETSGRLWVFDRTGRLLAECDDLDAPRALAFAPDGTLLVADGGAGSVRRYELGPREDLAPTPEE